MREMIEMVRMEFMLLRYQTLRIKAAKYTDKMLNYYLNNKDKFSTYEAREKLHEIYETCVKEAKDWIK